MTWLYRALRPALFALPAETAHQVTHHIGAGLQRTRATAILKRYYSIDDERLRIDRFGTTFSSPLGVAAGFDKNATMPSLLGALGFGHVEIGGVTARGQTGNPRPRMFRLPEDQAIINRMGFNNDGADRIADRLEQQDGATVPLGVNIGKTKEVPPERAPADYLYTYERLARFGDFFVINVSSPNTPGLRELQQRDHLDRIAVGLKEAGASPLLVKLSPDLHTDAVLDVCALVKERELDGIIATNTTVERPALTSAHATQSGGLSGAPLTDRSTAMISEVANATDVPIIGVGGIFTADDAYQKLRAGASLVQLYTALVYRGPGIAKEINEGLLALLERDGFESIEDVIGVDSD